MEFPVEMVSFNGGFLPKMNDSGSNWLIMLQVTRLNNLVKSKGIQPFISEKSSLVVKIITCQDGMIVLEVLFGNIWLQRAGNLYRDYTSCCCVF